MNGCQGCPDRLCEPVLLPRLRTIWRRHQGIPPEAVHQFDGHWQRLTLSMNWSFIPVRRTVSLTANRANLPKIRKFLAAFRRLLPLIP